MSYYIFNGDNMTYNLLGFKTRYLTVTEKLQFRSKEGRTQWRCLCICGNETILPTYAITKYKGTKTCGRCEWHIKKIESYTSWMAMKQRCNDSSRKDYKYYGKKGITYDPRWENFVEFFLDMGSPGCDAVTGERLSLDRKDNTLGYFKENCKWSTRSEQQLNKTITFKLEAGFSLEGK